MKNPWYCADCQVSVQLDRHGRCDTCGSDAVDILDRYGVSRNAMVSCQANPSELPQYAGAL